jgi:penicillin G amidase
LEDPDLRYFPAGTKAAVGRIAQQTMDAARTRLGDDLATWQWGRMHQAHWHHPIGDPAFAIGPRPVDGGSHTLRNTGGEMPPHVASSGAEYRIVVDFASPESFRAVQNIGNSGVPGSAHYMDQFEPWLRGEYHTVHLLRERVAAECESTTIIQPA